MRTPSQGTLLPLQPIAEPHAKVPLPAYPSFDRWLDCIARLPSGLGRIDAATLGLAPGPALSTFQRALHYLGFCDAKGLPTQDLRDFCAGDEAARKAILRAALQRSYPAEIRLLFDPDRRRELEAAFAGPAMSPETCRKAARFALKAHAYCEGYALIDPRSGVRRKRQTEGAALRAPAKSEKSVQLECGATLAVISTFQFFDLTPRDQGLVTDIVEAIRRYEESVRAAVG